MPEKVLETQLRELLTVVADALRRAADGVPEHAYYARQLDYTIDQVNRARSHLRACAESLARFQGTLPKIDL